MNQIKEANPYHQLQDYYYIKKENLNKLDGIKYKILFDFPISNTLFISNEEHWKAKPVYYAKTDFEKQDNPDHFNHITNEIAYTGKYSSMTDSSINYSDGFSYNVSDSLLNNNNAIVNFKTMAYTPNMKFSAYIVIEFSHNNQILYYQSDDLKDFINRENKWTPIYYSCIIPKEIQKDDQIKCYIWNICNYPVYIDDMEMTINTYQKGDK